MKQWTECRRATTRAGWSAEDASASRRETRTRMELSYSQNLEDYHPSLAFAGQTTGTYIDVGAGHPIADNVSFWFYERGWHGIVVEPQPELAALYQRLHPRDPAVRGFGGRHCGEIDFHVVDRRHGLSTTVKSLAKKQKPLASTIRPFACL